MKCKLFMADKNGTYREEDEIQVENFLSVRPRQNPRPVPRFFSLWEGQRGQNLRRRLFETTLMELIAIAAAAIIGVIVSAGAKSPAAIGTATKL